MMKAYLEPELNVVLIGADVITASDDSDDNEFNVG